MRLHYFQSFEINFLKNENSGENTRFKFPTIKKTTEWRLTAGICLKIFLSVFICFIRHYKGFMVHAGTQLIYAL